MNEIIEKIVAKELMGEEESRNYTLTACRLEIYPYIDENDYSVDSTDGWHVDDINSDDRTQIHMSLGNSKCYTEVIRTTLTPQTDEYTSTFGVSKNLPGAIKIPSGIDPSEDRTFEKRVNTLIAEGKLKVIRTPHKHAVSLTKQVHRRGLLQSPGSRISVDMTLSQRSTI